MTHEIQQRNYHRYLLWESKGFQEVMEGFLSESFQPRTMEQDYQQQMLRLAIRREAFQEIFDKVKTSAETYLKPKS